MFVECYRVLGIIVAPGALHGLIHLWHARVIPNLRMRKLSHRVVKEPAHCHSLESNQNLNLDLDFASQSCILLQEWLISEVSPRSKNALVLCLLWYTDSSRTFLLQEKTPKQFTTSLLTSRS